MVYYPAAVLSAYDDTKGVPQGSISTLPWVALP